MSTRDDQTLQTAAKLVGYEAQMLCVSLVAVANGSILLSDGVKNLVLESFLLHYRILRDFLYPKGSKKEDDVLAADYVTSWGYSESDWKEVVPDETNRLNKALAHLSYKRLDYAENPTLKQWEFARMFSALQQAFARFLHLVPPNQRAWFELAEKSLAAFQVAEP